MSKRKAVWTTRFPTTGFWWMLTPGSQTPTLVQAFVFSRGVNPTGIAVANAYMPSWLYQPVKTAPDAMIGGATRVPRGTKFYPVIAPPAPSTVLP